MTGERTMPEHEELAERDARRALRAVGFTIFLDLVGFGIILPVLPYFAEHLGASPAVVALLATVFSLAQLAMAPVLGRLSDRVGRRPVLLISVAGSAVSSALLGVADTLALVFVSRTIAGMSKANISTAQAYAADVVAPEHRAKVMGRLGAAASLGLVIGPGAGGMLAVDSLPMLPFWVTAGLSLINLALVWAWVPEVRRAAPARSRQQPPASRPARLRPHAGRDPSFRWLVGANFLFFAGYAGVQSTFALFTGALFGWESRQTGHLLMLMGMTMALIQGLAMGRVVARVGEAGAVMLGLVVFAGGAMALSTSAAMHSLLIMIAGSVLLVAGVGLIQASMATLISLVARAHNRGAKMGIRDASSAIGRILGPIAGGLLFEAGSPAWPFVVAGVAAAGSLAMVLTVRERLRTLERHRPRRRSA